MTERQLTQLEKDALPGAKAFLQTLQTEWQRAVPEIDSIHLVAMALQRWASHPQVTEDEVPTELDSIDAMVFTEAQRLFQLMKDLVQARPEQDISPNIYFSWFISQVILFADQI
jgi:hypothetical protein